LDGRGSGSRNSHERRDGDQQGSHGSNSKASAPKDAHTLEREARNLERVQKEAQRMAAAKAGSKRGREDGGGDDGGRKSRRTSRRSDARDGFDDEDRMRRLEAEREAGRWG